MNKLWTVVWVSVGDEPMVAIAPNDHNTHEDQGILVYESEEAAAASAKYQSRMYGKENDASAMRLDRYVAERKASNAVNK